MSYSGLLKTRRGGERGGAAEQQRVAVGFRAMNGVGAGDAAGARLVHHDHLHVVLALDRIGERANVDIGAAGGVGTIALISRVGKIGGLLGLSACGAGQRQCGASDKFQFGGHGVSSRVLRLTILGSCCHGGMIRDKRCTRTFLLVNRAVQGCVLELARPWCLSGVATTLK